VQALVRTASDHGLPLHILEAVEAVNDLQKEVLIGKIVSRLGEDLSDRTFALWGLAFKPNTDDMREAPSRRVIAELVARGARVKVYDPVAMDEARRVIALDFADRPDAHGRIEFCASQNDTLSASDALVIVTEWKAFRSPNFDRVKSELKLPLIFDGCNLYEPDAMAELGIEYHAIGRAMHVKA
jgi:UDPglucose 6-dehydrogenase